jgi:hypothetical protein
VSAEERVPVVGWGDEGQGGQCDHEAVLGVAAWLSGVGAGGGMSGRRCVSIGDDTFF